MWMSYYLSRLVQDVIKFMTFFNASLNTTSPITATVLLRYEKGVVVTNQLRLIRIGGPSRT